MAAALGATEGGRFGQNSQESVFQFFFVQGVYPLFPTSA